MKKIYIWLVCSVICFSSCSDVLDIIPNDKYSDGNVWQDQNLIKMFVNEQYNAISGKNNFYFLPFYSDEVFQKYNDGGCNYIRENILTSDNVGLVGGILNTWNDSYKYMQNINTFFVRIDESPVDESFKLTMKGEMRFLQAFIYARLIWAYGGVPIIEEIYDINSEFSQIKRNTWDECVKYIIECLDESIRLLPDRPEDRNRASANAARALKSRVLLYDASPLNNPANDKEKWQKAADAAAELFDKGYILEDDYRTMFLNVGNSEYIFAKEFNENYYHRRGFEFTPPGEGGQGWGSPSQNMVDAYEMKNGEIPVLDSEKGTINPNSTYDPAKPYENRDPRFYDCIYYNGAPYRGRVIETFQNGADMLTQDATLSGYYLRKFMDESITPAKTGHYSTPHPYFRLAEMYLNYAEAQFYLGKEDLAREYINKIRSRKSVSMPAVTATGEELLERIYHERRIELAFEDHRFYDVRRWKIADKTESKAIVGMEIVKEASNTFSYRRYNLSLESRKTDWKDAFYRLPIHYSEIQKSNNSLEQNPGY